VILADSSIWIAHFRLADPVLNALLHDQAVLCHPFIIGELAVGHLRQREIILGLLQNLPAAAQATDAEVLGFIDRHRLMGLGVGYIDAHLLVATRLTPDATLWTGDRRLRDVARGLGLAFAPK